MAKSKAPSASGMLAEIIIRGIQEKKGLEIVSIDLRELKNAISEYFVICHGTSRTHVEALAESVEKEVKTAIGTNPWHAEGFENSEWILLDYADVVVHIFQESKRRFFNLEGLWADARQTTIA
ncbi:MAG TPA: ribosome silencing factor [Bacteroidales bacterium]|nr:ribosome silencing factor [Bacteroidales bacterium]HSA42894.1 ribosome silencing factor [Bacteroidales bacterium]